MNEFVKGTTATLPTSAAVLVSKPASAIRGTFLCDLRVWCGTATAMDRSITCHQTLDLFFPSLGNMKQLQFNDQPSQTTV